MQFGIALPHIGPEASRDALVEVAQAAELLGFDSLWALDRLLWPLEPASAYPGNLRGRLPAVMQNTYDPLTVLTFVSACTRKVRLGTSVLVAGYRSPALLAKMAASMDQLSGGRLILGLGAGWSADEFAAVGQTFSGRRDRFHEYIGALDALWTEEEPEFHGAFYRISKSIFRPKPVQKPRPPIWIGGNSAAAVRSAAQFGDGWHPTNRLDAAVYRRSADSLRELAMKAGRDPKRISLSLRWNALEDLSDSSNVNAMISKLYDYLDVGVDHVCFDLNIPTPCKLGAMREAMMRLAWEVIHKVSAARSGS
jgi:probable F420-dependent oxidoreductase